MACEEELFSRAVPVKLKSLDREERLAVCFKLPHNPHPPPPTGKLPLELLSF